MQWLLIEVEVGTGAGFTGTGLDYNGMSRLVFIIADS